MDHEESYSITTAGVPARKNRRHLLVGKGRYSRVVNSPEFRALIIDVEAQWAKAGHPRRIYYGLWCLTIHAIWPRTRHLDHPVAYGDVDAPVSAVLDALQQADILDDDARVIAINATKEQGSTPKTIITLSRVC